MERQTTVKSRVSCRGIGLHSGKNVRLELIPAAENTGIVFIRKDRKGVRIPADPFHLVPTAFCTTLEADGVTVQTVEHLLAAIMAVGIDNLTVAIDGPEVPVLDGSALPFVSLLMEAGVERQSHIKSCIEFIRPVTVSCADKCVTISPSSSFEISCQIRFEHPLLAYQEYDYTHSRDAFIREIAPARTFGFLKDVPWLLSQGLAKGGSLENSVVIGEDDILNKEGMRFPDEFVRHKVLDLIGDLALLGMPMVGRVEAVSSGHRMHALLIQKILEETSAWRVTHTEEVSPYPLSHALLLR